MSSSFATDRISLYRLGKTDKGGRAYEKEPFAADLPACIQPGGTDVAVMSMINIIANKAFIIYLENVDVKVENGNQIIDQDDNKYIVRGDPEVYKSANLILKHQKIVAEKAV
jgi:hypothetical protein